MNQKALGPKKHLWESQKEPLPPGTGLAKAPPSLSHTSRGYDSSALHSRSGGRDGTASPRPIRVCLSSLGSLIYYGRVRTTSLQDVPWIPRPSPLLPPPSSLPPSLPSSSTCVHVYVLRNACTCARRHVCICLAQCLHAFNNPPCKSAESESQNTRLCERRNRLNASCQPILRMLS